MKLYYHKTSGGAEYLTDTFILCDNGHKEGTFEGANYIVRIDGDITKDAELTITSNSDLLDACKSVLVSLESLSQDDTTDGCIFALKIAIAKAEE